MESSKDVRVEEPRESKPVDLGEVQEFIGDIFQVPQGSVLIHACNCQGQWGSGIAAAMKAKFPCAYDVHRRYCASFPKSSDLEGTTQLIEPQGGDVARSGSYWIACLFTSDKYGKFKKKPSHIVQMTSTAFLDLRQQLQKHSSNSNISMFDGKLYSVRLNSKAFNTPWEKTRDTIIGSGLKVKVMNNIGLMNNKERRNVLHSMLKLEQDLANVQKYMNDLEIDLPKTELLLGGQSKKRKFEDNSDVESESASNESHQDNKPKKAKTGRIVFAPSSSAQSKLGGYLLRHLR